MDVRQDKSGFTLIELLVVHGGDRAAAEHRHAALFHSVEKSREAVLRRISP